MTIKGIIISALLLLLLTPSLGFAADKVVVIPLLEEVRCKCSGTLSSGGRWCDQGDGTVLDMTTGLVWLQKADWGGEKPWRNPSTDCSSPNYECYDDAHNRAASLKDGAPEAELSDGSKLGHWRLPTHNELSVLTYGAEPVNNLNIRAFTGVLEASYWSSTTVAGNTNQAWSVCTWFPHGPEFFRTDKTSSLYVWPVRSDK